MKKLLVLALTMAMVLSLAAVSMAAVTVGGEVKAIYNFDVPGNQNDKFEGAVTFNAQVNDQVSAFVKVKADSGNDNAFFDEYYFKVTGDLGTVQVGRFGFGMGVMDLLTKPVGDIKAEALIKYSNQLTDEFSIAFATMTDETTLEGGFDDGAYALNLDYATDTYGGNIYVQSNGYDNLERDTAIGVNIWVKPIENLKAYITLGNNYNVEEMFKVIGVEGSVGAFSYRAEYDIEDFGGDDNEWGFRLGYAQQNGLKWEYNRKATGLGYTTISSDISVKVEF